MIDGTAQASGLRTRFAGLLAPGLPADRLRALAKALGLTPMAEPAGVAPLVALLGGRGWAGPDAGDSADMDKAALWLPPVAAWIEPPAAADAAALTWLLPPLLAEAAGSDLHLSLTTGTAYDLQLGGKLTAALGARHPLAEERRDDIELALHEAVSNALVHGNLGVVAMREPSSRELDRFSHDLDDRLADPVLAARRVAVAIRTAPAEDGRTLATMDIIDEGAGFTPAPRHGSGASGRGLDLIGSVADELEIGDGGRRIRLRFRL
ncbi:hypothetical protein AZL_023500 [Azospirillum sp. B510]|uniref:ATP-binding protein n=1 Tax=Azospirillum sp. (strain B510) TaxID=137722 RepID=UPI0001C4C125|nr:ATP-binding protein [Azospirillum sp. B510]BAI72988.1 hypothetical protein AZL_023500 [Azospirillum sp. B510]